MPATSPSNRIPKDQRRQEILDRATELFSAKGFPDTTMDDVASAAAITKRTLYRYFPTKEALLHDIHDEFSGSSLVADLPETSDDPVERFRRLVTRHVGVVTRQTTEIAVFFDERKHLPDSLQTDINKRRTAYENLAVETIDAAERDGQFRAIDARVAARAILGSLTEFYRWFDSTGRLSAATLSDVAIDTFLHGIEVVAPQYPIDDAITEGVGLRVPAKKPQSASDKIRAAAIVSFARRGYRASSIRELGEVADVTKGAVMYHAQNKHALLEDIITTVMKDGISALGKADAMGGEPSTRLARMIAAHLTFMTDRRDEIAVANENLNYLTSAAHRRVANLRHRWGSLMENAIDDGVAAATFKTTDEFVVKRVIVGMLNSTYRWYRPAGTITVHELAKTYLLIILNGLESTA